MSKVTKTILILQLDSWTAAHSGASCCVLSTSSLLFLFPPPPWNRHIHAFHAAWTYDAESVRESWVTTVTLPRYSPSERLALNFFRPWKPFQLTGSGLLPELGVCLPRPAVPDSSFSLNRDVSLSCPAVQTVSGCISYRHWPEVIATRRILPHCVGQERGGRARAPPPSPKKREGWSEYLEVESGWQLVGSSLIQTHILVIQCAKCSLGQSQHAAQKQK